MIDIVIVNWNSGDYLRQCLQSLSVASNATLIQQLFIIDNNSSDDSLHQLPAIPGLVLLHNDYNTGFAAACNQGFSRCTAEYVLLLNPDTELLPDTLGNCLQYMEQQTNVEILGCQLLNEDGSIAKSCSRFPTPLRMCFDATGLSKIAPNIFTPAAIMTDWDHTESRFVDQVMGAFMFMRTSVFKRLGYFDERFFVYYEELDFSKRLATAGGNSFYYTGAKAKHAGAGTTNKVKGYRLFLNLRSRLAYAKKHFSYPGYLAVCCCTFIVEPFSRACLLLLTGRLQEIKDLLKGYRLLITAGKKQKDVV